MSKDDRKSRPAGRLSPYLDTIRDKIRRRASKKNEKCALSSSFCSQIFVERREFRYEKRESPLSKQGKCGTMRLVDHKSNFSRDKGVFYLHDNTSWLASQALELQETGRKRRAADIVAPWLDKHLSDAQRSRFRHCGDYLVYLETDDRTKRKLDVGFFCGIRLCPGCAWRESIRNAERVASISGALADQGRVMLMVTLIQSNV